MMWDIIADTLFDVIKLLPFLFLTYLAMEYLEHRAGGKAEALIKKAGRFGPVIGGVLVPEADPRQACSAPVLPAHPLPQNAAPDSAET